MQQQRSLPQHTLPTPLTPLVGRDREVAAVCALCSRREVRLVTLTGTGGVGKTRLALEVAAVVSSEFADGICFVALTPLTDPGLVASIIAQALGVREQVSQPLLDSLKDHLRDRHLLLLLDNFEQIVSAAPVVAQLLVAAPRLHIMVTSRTSLHLSGEHEFVVPPLSLPDLLNLPPLDRLTQYGAVHLFIERAQAVQSDFALTKENATAIAAICHQVDGLPLAIELAAGRSKLFSPQALLPRLRNRLKLLVGGAQDLPLRQQTLRGTIAWSYDLLEEAEKTLFRRLAVFVGGCTLETAEAVCNTNGDLEVDMLDAVAVLVDKSLLRQQEQADGEPRLLMLETIREYALETLKASGELEATRRAHAAYYLALAEQAEAELEGPQQVRWLERLEGEHDNLRTALRWSLEQGEAGHSMELALRLGAALGRFWNYGGHYNEGWTFLERALAESQGVMASVRAKALLAAVWLGLNGGDIDLVETLCEESLTLSRELDDKEGIAETLSGLGHVAMDRGDLEVACSLMEEAMSLAREMGDRLRIASGIHDLAWVRLERGEYARARAMYEECLVTFRELGDEIGIAASLHQLALVLFLSLDDQVRVDLLLEESLALWKELGSQSGIALWSYLAGQVALRQDDTAQARSLLEESVVLFKNMGDRRHTAGSIASLARVEALQSNYAAARTLYEESLALCREVGDKNIAPALEGLAGVVAAQREPAWAARLWGAAKALRDAIGAPLPPVYHADYDRSVAAVRSSLGEKAFAATWAQGRAMTPEQAIVQALETKDELPTDAKPSQANQVNASSFILPGVLSSPPSPRLSPRRALQQHFGGLTSREREVARMVAQGKSNRAIADELVVGVSTVEAHVSHIFTKLGFSSRAQIAAWAVNKGLGQVPQDVEIPRQKH